MSQTKRDNEPPAIIELLLPLIGLLLVAVFFLPAFRHWLGSVLFFGVGLVALSLVVGMALYIRHLRKLGMNTPAAVAPPVGIQEVWSRDLLSRMEWKRFEELTAAYARELGYTVKTEDGAAPGGPVLLYKGGQAKPAMLMRCRTWDSSTVGLDAVRELHEAMAARQVGYGVFYTAGEFTREADEFAHGKIIDLVNGTEFVARLRQLVPAVQQKLLEEATEGDYTTPTCPGCDIKMVPLVEGSKPTEGSPAWVCRNRPQCSRTLRVA